MIILMWRHGHHGRHVSRGGHLRRRLQHLRVGRRMMSHPAHIASNPPIRTRVPCRARLAPLQPLCRRLTLRSHHARLGRPPVLLRPAALQLCLYAIWAWIGRERTAAALSRATLFYQQCPYMMARWYGGMQGTYWQAGRPGPRELLLLRFVDTIFLLPFCFLHFSLWRIRRSAKHGCSMSKQSMRELVVTLLVVGVTLTVVTVRAGEM